MDDDTYLKEFAMNRQLKVLTVGNSFGKDTSKHIYDIARSLGFESVRVCVLYIGGCSLNKHYENALGDLPLYAYHTNCDGEWQITEGKCISEAIAEDDWDYISIQHGTADGSRYTLPESYVKLEALIAYIKKLAHKKTKIVFNMAWVMATDGTHPEIRFYAGDQLLMYKKLTELTSTVVEGTKGLDIVSPAGTAVQNARVYGLPDDKLMRDGFHMSYGLGRYIAGLTFIKALTGVEIDGIEWCPEDVTKEEKDIAIRCANAAIEHPYSITKI